MKNKITLSALAIIFMGSIACHKDNPIDNSQTIKVPYELFTGSQTGEITKTNNGESFNIMHYGGGIPIKSIWILDTNLLFANARVNIGSGMGPTENYAFKIETSFIPLLNDQKVGIYTKLYYPNAACYDENKKVMYMCSSSNLPNTGDLYENSKSGTISNWGLSPVNGTHNAFSSVTKTDDGNIYIFDNVNNFLFVRNGGVGNFTQVAKSTTNDIFKFGGGEVFIGHYHNRLLSFDLKTDSARVFYSDNQGVDWFRIKGPGRGRFLMAKPMSNSDNFYASIDSVGLFRLVGDSLQSDNGGLPPNIRIWDIAGKRNVYMTGDTKYYFYLASNLGLFRSNNGAKDWFVIKNEAITSLY